MRLLFAALLLSVATPAAAAGTLVVAGDITPTFALGPDGFGGVAGNRTFFTNLLGGVTTVAISSRTFNGFSNGNVQQFYSGLGANVTTLADPVSAASLAGIGLLVVQFPNTSFTTSEASAIGGFLRDGGRVYLSGEASSTNTMFPAGPVNQGRLANTALNGLLGAIGATIRLDDTDVGCCGNLLTTAIGQHPLTAGVTSFGYGFATSVSGGTALVSVPGSFLDPALRPIIAVETFGAAMVPEPGSWAMLIAGFGVTGSAMRRRRSGTAHAT